jgi:hypothetical protein
MAQFDFDDDTPGHDPREYEDAEGDPRQELSQGVDQALGDLEQEEVPEREELSEVEKRFDLASYYKLLLNHDFFDVTSPRGRQVEREIRAFIKNRLEVLLGMRDANDGTLAVTQPSQFSPQETGALKALAAKVLGKPNILVDKPKKVVPVLKPAAVTDVTPAPRPPAVVARPVAKTSPGPVARVPKAGSGKVPGSKYKRHTVIKKNAEGKEYVADLTQQVRPSPGQPQPVPMPMGQAMTDISAQQAGEVVAAQKFPGIVGKAVEHSLTTKE